MSIYDSFKEDTENKRTYKGIVNVKVEDWGKHEGLATILNIYTLMIKEGYLM